MRTRKSRLFYDNEEKVQHRSQLRQNRRVEKRLANGRNRLDWQFLSKPFMWRASAMSMAPLGGISRSTRGRQVFNLD